MELWDTKCIKIIQQSVILPHINEIWKNGADRNSTVSLLQGASFYQAWSRYNYNKNVYLFFAAK
jgi:hypothetical protein